MSKRDWMIFIMGFFGIPCATWFFSTRRELFIRIFVRGEKNRQVAEKELPKGDAFKRAGRIFAILQLGMAAIAMYFLRKHGWKSE